MDKLKKYLIEKSVNKVLSETCLQEAKSRFSLSHAEIEMCCLNASLLPSRYQRNQKAINTEEQLKLFSSRVAVVGCGGLGGHIIEELARLGVGQILAIDPDVFEEHNLNRQLFSSPQVLGQSKAEIAATRVAEINPAVTVHSMTTSFCRESGSELLKGADVVADAVDSIPVRLELASSCRDQGLPLVHGAIAGWYGHVCTVFPEEMSLEKIYRNRENGGGIEQELGNPAFTPAVIASFQVAEICKVLLGKKGLLRNRMLVIDLLDMEVEEILL